MATLAAALALAPGAQAATAYSHAGEFGGTGSDPGLFSADPLPQRLAVHEESGKVLVADTGNDRVQVFEPTASSATFAFSFGSPATTDSPIGVAIDQDTGDAYVTAAGTTNAIVKLNPDDPSDPATYAEDPTFTSPTQGTGTGEIGSFGSPGTNPSPGGIAVDPTSGDILVADPGRNLIQRFDSDGAFLDDFNGLSFSPFRPAFTGVRDLAVASTGDIIVADVDAAEAEARIDRFDSAGTLEATLSQANDPVPNDTVDNSSIVVAVDPGTDEVFVSSKSPDVVAQARIFQFEDGEHVFDFTVTLPGLTDRFNGYLFGIAARGADPGRLYAMATQSFGFPAPVPRVQAFDDVGELADAPTVELGTVEGVTATEAAFTGRVDHGGAETSWRFEYVTEDEFQATEFDNAMRTPVPDGELEGTEEVPVDVEATAQDLEPNTDYRVRLAASNSGGSTGSDPAQFTTDAAPPQVVGARAIAGATMATFQGRVNPRNSQTTWRLEYRRQGATEWMTAGEGDAGDRGSPVGVIARAQGLQPEAAYEFRLLAENEDGGPPEGPAEGSFETGEALPQRAFELVSPVPTGGVNISTGTAKGAAEDGNRVLFPTFFFPLPGTESVQIRYVATRGPGGWATRPVDVPPQGQTWTGSGAFRAPSRDVSRVLLSTLGSFDPDDQNADLSGTPPGSGPGQDLYLRQPGGELTWISRDPRIPAGEPQTDDAVVNLAGSPGMSSMSVDGRVVVFTSERNLLDEDPNPSGSGNRLYKWSDGELALASVRPDGSAPTGAVLGNSAGDFAPNVVSRDGSRVFWKDASGSGGRLFVQIDGEGPLEASKPQDGLSGTPGRVDYAGAAADGSRVFFTANRRLTPDSGGSHGGNPGDRDLYAFDVDAALAGDPVPLRDLTPRLDGGADPNDPPENEDRARVLGVAAVADDGQSVYFVADGQLDAQPSPSGEEPAPEGRNLYLAELGDDIEGEVRVRFIAGPLAAGSDEAQAIWSLTGGSAWSFHEAHASPDGSVLAFGSTAGLIAGQPTDGFRQVYVYDDHAGSLACPSCPGDGSPPDGPRVNSSRTIPSPGQPFFFLNNGNAKIRWVSEGGTVFFHAPTALAPDDTNTVDDVYEYRRGELRLVSGGAGNARSDFFDASADGSTVFFLTRDALVPQDGEPGVRKVYAARVGGGFEPPPPPPPPCFGDGCQGDSPPPSEGGDLGSRASEGRGDLVDNRFGFGRAKMNKRRGKARLTVRVPGPGELELARNRKVKPAERTARSQGKVRLQVKPTRKAKRKLRRMKRRLRSNGRPNAKAKVRVKASVTFTPEGGEPRAKTKRLRLVKR